MCAVCRLLLAYLSPRRWTVAHVTRNLGPWPQSCFGIGVAFRTCHTAWREERAVLWALLPLVILTYSSSSFLPALQGLS